MELKPIKVEYQWTDNAYRAKQWLEALGDPFAADFETANRLTKQQIERLATKSTYTNLSFEERRIAKQQAEADGLSHPKYTCITHLNIADSSTEGKVIVCNNEAIRKLCFNFLVTTEKTQLWHNASFDFRHIYYNTGLLPKKYIDTQLLAKCLLNDADSAKDITRLKYLMGSQYGAWAISKDNFTLEQMYDKDVLLYAATDACATYKLYQDILDDLNRWKI